MTISLKRHKIFFPHFIYCTIRSTDVILFYIIPNVSFSSSLPPKVKNPFSSCTISIESEVKLARFGVIKSTNPEKSLSIGTEVAGIAKTSMAILDKFGNATAHYRGDRGYVGHFLIFPLSNVFKE